MRERGTRRAALLALAALPLLAAAPTGADRLSAAAEWFRTLRDARGVSCCDEADCRRTAIRPGEDGELLAWIGKQEFGPDAPDEWRPVPASEIRSRGNRPPGVRGAIICFYGGRVACADLEAGL